MLNFTHHGPKHRTENRRAMVAGRIASPTDGRDLGGFSVRNPTKDAPMSNDPWRAPPVSQAEPIRPRLLNTKQACDYIGGMSRSGFFDFRKRWSVPAVQLAPKVLRFDVADLDAAIERAKAVPGVSGAEMPAAASDPPTPAENTPAVAAEPDVPVGRPRRGGGKAKRGR